MTSKTLGTKVANRGAASKAAGDMIAKPTAFLYSRTSLRSLINSSEQKFPVLTGSKNAYDSTSEHDERLGKTLTLNDKCDFSKRRIKFLGQLIDTTGVSANPDKVGAVKAMAELSNVSEVSSPGSRTIL
ncbi:hypothetical protein JOB18_037093 [Solea senegalensis]|uniref:Uncharacterized protein n=1 Tax=Solea senegalensis TaxID=28829 RepID=A0AAV6SFR7_SOLSE|nr:hypothetical protein JOB18_037093 [Solea senegalensis]